MKKCPFATLFFSATLSAVLLGAHAPMAWAQDAPPPAAPPPAAPEPKADAPIAPQEVQNTFDAMLSAIEKRNRAAFVAQADAHFKAALTLPIFQAVADQIAARLQAGQETLYFGSMKKGGFTVYLWRIRFSDGGDDLVVQMSLKDDQVGGFFLS